MIVVADAVPFNDEGSAYQLSDDVEPVSGFGVTDQVDPASTSTDVGAVLSVSDVDAPFET